MMIVVMCALVAWLAIYSRLPYKPHNKVLTYSKATLTTQTAISLPTARPVQKPARKPTISFVACKNIMRPLAQHIIVRAGLPGHQFDMYVYPPKDDVHVSGSIVRSGVWEQHIIRKYFLPALQAEKVVFVDVGANIGMYTLIAAELAVETYAFEALRKNVEMVCSSVNRNSQIAKHVSLHYGAVSNHSGDLVSVRNQAAVDETHNIGGTSFHLGAGEHTVKTITMNKALSFLHNQRIVLKIDVEGMECNAFEGAHQFLQKNYIKMILMEWAQIKIKCGERLARQFHNLGLRPHDPSLLVSDATNWPVWDIIWLR